MPPLLSRGISAFRALQELGPRQVFTYAGYKASLHLGLVERRVKTAMRSAAHVTGSLANDLLAVPDPAALLACLGPTALRLLFAEADEICAGQVRLFGGAPVPLQLDLPGEKHPWIHYEGLSWLEEAGDIKLAWEPARFGWAVILARAYRISDDPRYAEAFWHWTEVFFTANPPGVGPQWASAQEVSLRLICLVFAWQVFSGAHESTPARAASLASWIAIHAARIPPTLGYARAQNNNHLLSEAAGLYTAGLALPNHAQARRWRALGWHWLNRGLLDQIDLEGVYSQHSANYHRLMLQLALWCNSLADRQGVHFPEAVMQRLSISTRWLATLLDPTSGELPNLGSNDGAYILPLSTSAFSDYRPVLQAAGIAFDAFRVSTPGAWDEMALWHGLDLNSGSKYFHRTKPSRRHSPVVLQSANGSTWAYLRAAKFTGRPGHADQLHLDLWKNGTNLALDAGTYLYNAPSPWDNRLAQAFVHNTITLDGQDQMLRAGRFLYLRRAQAEITDYLSKPEHDWERLTAHHNGYRSLGINHVRQVERTNQRWLVRDQIFASRGQIGLVSTARLHWLLPDFPWNLVEEDSSIYLRLDSPDGPVSLHVSTNMKPASFLLVRAGELQAGTGDVLPISGWFSPTYNVKIPALSLSFTTRGTLPLEFTTAWELGED